MWDLLSAINRFFARQNKWTIWVIAIIASFVVGGVDFLTNTHLTWLVFYILPACFVGWYTGRRPAILIATFGAFLWYFDKAIHPPTRRISVGSSSGISSCASACSTFAAFFSSEVAARRLAEDRQRQTNEALRQQTNILESILNSMGDGVIVADATGKIFFPIPKPNGSSAKASAMSPFRTG